MEDEEVVNMKPDRTPTEVLVQMMEEFGKDEPAELLICYRGHAGQFCWDCSSSNYVSQLGLAHMTIIAIENDLKKAQRA